MGGIGVSDLEVLFEEEEGKIKELLLLLFSGIEVEQLLFIFERVAVVLLLSFSLLLSLFSDDSSFS